MATRRREELVSTQPLAYFPPVRPTDGLDPFFLRLGRGWVDEHNRFGWPMSIIVLRLAKGDKAADDSVRQSICANISSVVRDVDHVTIDGDSFVLMARTADLDVIADRLDQMVRYGLDRPAPRITGVTIKDRDFSFAGLYSRAAKSRRQLVPKKEAA